MLQPNTDDLSRSLTALDENSTPFLPGLSPVAVKATTEHYTESILGYTRLPSRIIRAR